MKKIKDIYYYKHLNKNNLKNENFDGNNSSKKNENSDESNSSNKYKIDVIKNSNEVITSKDSKSAHGHIMTKEDDYKNIEERTKYFVKNVVDGIPDEDRGLFPAYQQELLNRILEPPKISWKQVLKKYVGVIPIPSKKTRLRLNRRQPERYDISGSINDRTIRIVVAIDTSGSMSNKMLEYIFNEIFEILKNVKFELTVIECDCEIGKIYKAKRKSDINFNVTGRGGTCYTPVIEYINKNNFRDALLVYFTDGFAEPEIPKPRTYRNLWVVIGNKDNLSLSNPYGEKITLDIKDMY